MSTEGRVAPSYEDWLHWQKLVSDEHDRQAAKLRRFAQWVAAHSNDPLVVAEATRICALHDDDAE